ncbi:brix domain containing protein [Anaeramoeba flamelloides]|uniref:Ribosome production factor 2 homolog n=1 Tax=Anaeramoeba flamelloides TaxID=1746091 RepID=A0AAV8A6U0_9EUKA|nr:brix domain containing protein [Anaeramoeba flamelloides]KAJ6246257.1 brix domain containing protein [Anaeramoeba flamelloides]
MEKKIRSHFGKRTKGVHRRRYKKKQPKVNETVKNVLFLKGRKTSENIRDLLTDLYLITKPNAHKLTRKNDIVPFDDETSLEFLCNKNDCGLFVFGSHTKKRPNNLIVGRVYDNHLYDMVEFGVDSLKTIHQIKGETCVDGTKPLLIFNGDGFQFEEEYKMIKNIFIDLFKGVVVQSILLTSLQKVISFTIYNDQILVRTYKTQLSKSSGKSPNVDLTDMGPNFNLTKRRIQIASSDLTKTATWVHPSLRPKKVKNVSRNKLGDKVGRIHMGKQNYNSIATRKMKAFKKKKTNNRNNNYKK